MPDNAPTPVLQDQSANPSLAATTTFQQDLTAAGNRYINVTWEDTQKKIALWAVGVALLVASVLAMAGKLLAAPELQLAAVVFIFGVANLIVGFYFGRTNHARNAGGFAPRPEQ